jgi:uncharacterized iron-regulated membrane protein
MNYWYKIHRWISLICAIFFLLLCITGLPLLFKNEIHDWNLLEQETHSMPMPYEHLWEAADQGKTIIESSYPNKVVKSISSQAKKGQLLFRVQDKDSKATPAVRMSMGGEQIAYEIQTGSLHLHDMNAEAVKYPFVQKFMHWMHVLHMRMGLGNGGMIFLAFMCFLSLVSIISGIWIYAPFMRETAFGMIGRTNARTFWMDWHKFTGALTTVWAAILCFSGVMIVVFSLSYGTYIADSKNEAAKNLPVIKSENAPLSIPQAIAFMNTKFPDQFILSIDLPEKHQKSPQYIFYITPQKENPTEYLGQLVFVPASAANKEVFFTKALPWYFPFVSFALDLHVHNHEMLSLKILWALFTLLTIIMIVSGVYAWMFRYPLIASKSKFISSPEKNSQRKKNAIWRMPIFIGILSILGMIAPLYSEIWQDIGFIALVLPLILLGIYWYRSHHNTQI